MRLMLLTALAALGCGCGDNQDPEGARALWQSIHAQDYRSFQRAPGYEVKRDSNAPHRDQVLIYVNQRLADALSDGKPIDAWPEGSLIVKEGYDGSELELVAVMDKRKSGWYWAEYDASGDASYSGAPDLCTDCHRSGADYVRAFSLPQ